MRALDFRASRATAMNPDLSHYRIIHFATHGLVNSEHPELSGLVLSLVDKDGKPQNGFLQLQDIYNLNLPADLVVLSACETALGKEISGEGLIGLTRGFMYAGASRVVASLWKVSDVATAKLMAEFLSRHGKGRHAGFCRAARGPNQNVEAAALERSVLLGGVSDPGRVEVKGVVAKGRPQVRLGEPGPAATVRKTTFCLIGGWISGQRLMGRQLPVLDSRQCQSTWWTVFDVSKS